MLAIGMDVHSSKTSAYAVSLDESDMDACAIAEDFNRNFKNFYSDHTILRSPRSSRGWNIAS